MVLIVGGTGTLGSIVATQLLATGSAVRVMSRTPAGTRAAALREAGAQVVAGDLRDRESVVRACAGVDAIVAGAHSMLGRGRAASVHVDGAGHRALIDIAKAQRVGHMVYTSVFDYGPAYHAVPFFRIKREVEQYLATSGLSHTILRPTAFMDFHAHTLIGEPVLTKGRVVLFGRGERPRNFVAARDVSRFLVRALADSDLAGEIVNVGGPENLTAMDVVRLYERAAGRPARVTRIPLVVAEAGAVMTRPLHPGLSQVLQAAALAETTDQRFDARTITDRFPIELTRLDTWISERVGAASGAGAR